MADSTIALLDFHGDQLLARLLNDARRVTGTTSGIFVAVNPICAALGISARGQRKRIESHPRLRDHVKRLQLPSYSGDQVTFCLPIDYVPEWIIGINPSRITTTVGRARVAAAQQECRVIVKLGLPSTAEFFRQGELTV